MDGIDPIALATVNSLGKNVARDADEKTALRAFDAYFLGEMLKRTAPQNPTGLFDGGQAGRMYQDHYYEELARIIAQSGSFGVSGALEGRLGPRADDAPSADPAERGNGLEPEPERELEREQKEQR